MADNQNPIPDHNRIINELMSEHCQGVEEVHLEPKSETVTNAEPKTQPVAEEPAEEERAAKRQKTVRHTEEEETESKKDFVSVEAKDIWNRLLADKGFINERGFGKLIPPFFKIIEKRGWECFCAHTMPGFAALAREFYANMVGMRKDSVYMRGFWVPFGNKRINEMFKLKELKNDSKFKKLVENPDHEKIINLLTARQGKWEATRKNPRHAINGGSLSEEANVWFYFLS